MLIVMVLSGLATAFAPLVHSFLIYPSAQLSWAVLLL